MSMFTCHLIDGYELDLGDGYSINSNWVDIHSSPFFSISVVFSGGTPAGALELQVSNDLNSNESSRGLVGSAAYMALPPGMGEAQSSYPISAGWLQGNPLDMCTLPLSLVTVSGGTVSGNTVLVSASGAVMFICANAAFRWVRLNYTESSDENVQIDAWMHRKAQTGHSG